MRQARSEHEHDSSDLADLADLVYASAALFSLSEVVINRHPPLRALHLLVAEECILNRCYASLAVSLPVPDNYNVRIGKRYQKRTTASSPWRTDKEAPERAVRRTISDTVLTSQLSRDMAQWGSCRAV
jgi:hypothetical protein